MMIKEPPEPVAYVVQIDSKVAGQWMDIISFELESSAWESMDRRQRISPHSTFQVIKRVTTDTPLTRRTHLFV